MCATVVMLSFIACSGPSSGSDGRHWFVYNASDGIRSLDPGKATDLETLWVVDQLYEGLLELDAGLRVVPALADQWSVSEDGLRHHFHLRDAQFHNGEPVTAMDVKASFLRLLDPSEALPGRWVLKGLRPEGIQVLGEDSLVLVLQQPQPTFGSMLATPQASVLFEGGHAGSSDVEDWGSGPFVLKGWLPQTALVLHRFDRYWMRDEDGAALPYLDGVRIEFNREEGSEMLGFRQGRYDFVSAPSPEWMQTVMTEDGQWKPEWAGRFERHSTPYLRTDYIGVLLDSSSLAASGFDVIPLLVRKAMTVALDREALVRQWRPGGAQPARGFVPPGMPGFGADVRAPHAMCIHSPDSAKAWLASLNIGPEPPLKRWGGLVLGTKPATADLAAALQHIWSSYGIDVRVDVAPSGMDAERVAQGEVPLFRKSWLADYPDAENFLGLFDDQRWAPNGPNYTHFSDPSVQMGLVESSRCAQGPKRDSLLRAIESEMLNQVPVIPLWHEEVLHLVAKEWEGWQTTPTNRLDLRRVRSRVHP